MNTFVPSYYEKFSCIADRCPDTCCIGWEVDIDSVTASLYGSVTGALGDKIRHHLATDDEGSRFFTLCDGERCPFLLRSGLCEIQKTVSEKFLSKTCTLFPRFFDDFGTFRETGLGFGCPEAARIILCDEAPFTLVKTDDPDFVPDDGIDEAFLDDLLSLRTRIFSILEDHGDFRCKITLVLSMAAAFQKKLDGDAFLDECGNRSFSDCLAVMRSMEYISKDREAFIHSMSEKKHSDSSFLRFQGDFEKLMKYYIYRYLLKAVFDYDALTKVKYGIFACIVIAGIYSEFENPDFDTRLRIMYSYSKEVEYSDLNMKLLDDVLYSSFGTEDLLSLL